MQHENVHMIQPVWVKGYVGVTGVCCLTEHFSLFSLLQCSLAILKNASEAIFYHLYAEIVKFGQILTHLELFWGQTGREENMIRVTYSPKPPLWHRHCL